MFVLPTAYPVVVVGWELDTDAAERPDPVLALFCQTATSEGEMRVFTVTENHIKLIRRMYVTWEAWEGTDEMTGWPSVNPKRPYGNSDVLGDIARILDVPQDITYEHGEKDWSEEVSHKLWAIHRETEEALQILLRTGSLEPGVYEAPRCTPKWRRRDEE